MLNKIITILLSTLLSTSFLLFSATKAPLAKELNSFQINSASGKYDFTIQFDKDCDQNNKETMGSCEGSGAVTVLAKSSKRQLQTFRMENIFLSFTDKSEPLINSAELYEYQGVINVGDFNFDGHEDLAIQNGNNGSYGGPSYDVYLYNPASRKFVLNEPLTNLILETLGFFQLDTSKKPIKTAAKSGCCYHESVEYRIKGNRLEPIHRIIEDATDPNSEYVTISEEELVNGKWRSRTEKKLIKNYYK